VYGSNQCRVWCRVSPRSGRILAVGVIDNLVKGAAGQAIQNMNIMFGLPESLGLEQIALLP
jgi:N-acetyl-gamma-glutamyl-phosphate reductase